MPQLLDGVTLLSQLMDSTRSSLQRGSAPSVIVVLMGAKELFSLMSLSLYSELDEPQAELQFSAVFLSRGEESYSFYEPYLNTCKCKRGQREFKDGTNTNRKM